MILIVFALLIKSVFSIDWTIANTSIWLSSATYCPENSYLNRTYIGHSKEFIPKFAIENDDYDTHGFIGYIKQQKIIYIVFKGTTSITNWINDFDIFLDKYDTCHDCYVHDGFYETEQSVIQNIVKITEKLTEELSDYKIVVTGHSLGGAVATLAALDLIHQGMKNVMLYNFGSPRVGNEHFASYASEMIKEHYRFTNHRDVVPHCPYHETFTHIDGEWYEDPKGIKNCDGYEDPSCSYQWYITSIEDHMQYLGLDIGCHSVSIETTNP